LDHLHSISPREYWTSSSENYVIQLADFFSIGGENLSVDLPGYGTFHSPVGLLIIEAFFKNTGPDDKKTVFSVSEDLPKLQELLQAYLNSLPETLREKHDYNESSLNSTQEPPAIRLTNDPIMYMLLSAILIVYLIGFALRRLDRLIASMVNFKVIALQNRSKDFLSILEYSVRSEDSGTFSPVKWFSFARKRVRTQRQLTLPALTGLYIKFIQEAAPFFNGKMIISIDELDKIDDLEHVKSILREVKGGLFVPHTYYLISISQDAADAFQSRIASGRDIFESTFDEVLFINQVDSEQAWAIIHSRIQLAEDSTDQDSTASNILQGQSLSDPELTRMKKNATVISLIGAGIPREIVRNYSEIVREHESFSIADPASIALTLLVKKVERMLNDIAKVQTSNENSIALYERISKLHEDLTTNTSKDQTTRFDRVRVAIAKLNECLGIVGNDSTETQDEDEQPARDIPIRQVNIEARKQLTELLALTKVLQYVQDLPADEEFSKPFTNRIYSALNVLNANPSLARHILFNAREINFNLSQTSKH